jgi:hypothetical protein
MGSALSILRKGVFNFFNCTIKKLYNFSLSLSLSLTYTHTHTNTHTPHWLKTFHEEVIKYCNYSSLLAVFTDCSLIILSLPHILIFSSLPQDLMILLKVLKTWFSSLALLSCNTSSAKNDSKG